MLPIAAPMIGSMSSAAWKAWRIFFDVIRPSLWFGTAVIQPYGLTTRASMPVRPLDAIVLVLLDLLREVVLPRLDAGQAHRHVGNGEEEDLVDVGRPLAPVAVRRLRRGRCSP